MSLLQEEVAKLLGRECEQMHIIEDLKAEANGEIWQCTIAEPQCELQCEHTEKAWLGLTIKVLVQIMTITRLLRV